MSARALGVIVTGGRHYVLSADDFLLIEGTMRTVGANAICTDGRDGVADQVEAWARQRDVPVWRVTDNWIHEGPATPAERSATLVGLARTVIAFPGEGPTDELLEKARRRRLRIVESPGRMAQRPTLAPPFPSLIQGPRQRTGISPKL
jgi:hypothetical protein